MPVQSTLATAAAVTGAVVVATGVFVYRLLAIGAHAPKSFLFLGTPKPDKVADKLLAENKSSSEPIQVNIDAPDYTLVGTVEPKFAPVLDVFLQNVAEGHEVGAGFCFYVGGKKVIDIAGGRKRTNGQDYDLESVNTIFSSGKAIMSVIVTYCVSKGYLKFEDRVADIWPEFAQGGKENVLVKDILQSRGGVAFFDPENRLTAEECLDLDGMEAKIARQKHNFGGVKTQIYHGLTRGWFINAILRRVHPKKFSAKDIYTQEILPLLAPNDNYGHAVHISVPETPEVMQRVRDVVPYPTWRILLRFLTPSFMNSDPLPPHMIKRMKTPNPYINKIGEDAPYPTQPDPVTGAPPTKDFVRIQNSWSVRRGQHTSFGVVTNARAMARLAALMANGGELDGTRIIDAATVAHANESDPWIQEDLILGPGFGEFTNGGFGVSQDVLCPAKPPEQKWVDKGKGWRWLGWAGFGGSMMQFEPNRNLAFG